ncbi:MAG: hypothetical protein GXP43_01345 [bacterium]|nr:hypothetical protein [bacterium]
MSTQQNLPEPKTKPAKRPAKTSPRRFLFIIFLILVLLFAGQFLFFQIASLWHKYQAANTMIFIRQ